MCPIKNEASGSDKNENLQWVSGLRPVKGKEWKGMEARMGRAPGSVGLKK